MIVSKSINSMMEVACDNPANDTRLAKLSMTSDDQVTEATQACDMAIGKNN
jgi:hypothetical protein